MPLLLGEGTTKKVQSPTIYPKQPGLDHETPTSTTTGRAPSLLPIGIHRPKRQILRRFKTQKLCAQPKWLQDSTGVTVKHVDVATKVVKSIYLANVFSWNMAMENPIGFEKAFAPWIQMYLQDHFNPFWS